MVKSLGVIFLILMVSAAASSAQVPCRARTCTQALRACMGLRCMQMGQVRQHKHPSCGVFCNERYEECLTTGEFRGKVCHNTELLRQ